MTKLIKFLKPFKIPLLFAVILLFCQAQADLALPDSMADIVNVGIQQNGFDSPTLEVIDKEGYEKISLFLDENGISELNSNYQLIDNSHSDYGNYLEKYPNMDEEFYVLTTEEFDSTFMEIPLMMVGGMEQMVTSGEEMEINGKILPKDTDLFALLKMMPKSQIDVMINTQIDILEELGDTVITQGAIQYKKSLYQAYGADIENIQNKYILTVGLKMLLITLLGAIATITVGFISSRIAAGVGRNLREKLFSKVSLFSNKEYDEFSTASLITRSTNDVSQVQNLLVMMIRMVFYAPLLGIGGVIKVLGSNSSMTWIIALAVSLLVGLIMFVFLVAVPKFKLIQKLVDRLNLVTRENLSGMLVIRAFNTQKFEEDRFAEANSDLMKNNLFVNRVMVAVMPIMMLIMNGTILLVVWVGSNEIAASNMLVGDMMAVMQYSIQIIMAFLMMSMMFILIPRAAVSAVRINEILETDLSIVDKSNPKTYGKAKGVIKFNDVSFKYSGAEESMLKNISFESLPGQTTAIIGSTGSGKSTLMNLIPRFYDVSEGSIEVDGNDIKDLSLFDLREMIGYIPQKSVLFSGTIESNIKYSNSEMDDGVMEEALSIAQGTEIASEKAEGYQSNIAQGGSNVSGGQKQRISIARAIAKDPQIYLFDDSFSALDFKTDKDLRNALNEKVTDKTFIIIAQRISTIKKADQILVLDEGRIVGKGKHDELLKNCKTYQEIAYSQLSKEELA